jgi:DNA-binding transcriptional MerR regulator
LAEIITAFTDEQVSKLTGISVGQLRYWDRTDFFKPEFAYEERRDAFSRVYSYLDLVSLKIIARLRSRVPLQRLRIVKQQLPTPRRFAIRRRSCSGSRDMG